MLRTSLPFLFLLSPCCALLSAAEFRGRVLDPQGHPVPRARLTLERAPERPKSATTESDGTFHISGLAVGQYRVTAEAEGFTRLDRTLDVPGAGLRLDLALAGVAGQHQSLVIFGRAVEPQIDLRNAEVFQQTLFTRDDQVMQQLAAGISAGQHEGGGKSLEIRRYGFNMDHGGVGGGIKILLDGVQQNQGTQGHGQGYLGAMKSITPELIEDVTIINGPFSAEYGDFSGLGVVHVRQRETLGDQYTARLQGGNFDTARGFLAYSPNVARTDAYLAYEGSYTNGPFALPSRYRRDNINGNYARTLRDGERAGVRILLGRNDFFSSGQLPLDLVQEGVLDRFGFLDPTHGGNVRMGTASGYYSRLLRNGDTWKVDGSVTRSLFDLYSNFTYFLNDPVHGDAIQQHDSRLQEGLNTQYTKPHRAGTAAAVLVGGANYHDSQVQVGLYPRQGRVPTGVTARDHARIANGAGYVQENLSLLDGRLRFGGGLRYDYFHYGLRDTLYAENNGSQSVGRWQGKASAAVTPSRRVPITWTANYGRGINSVDVRAAVRQPDQPRLGTTDFYQTGLSANHGRFSWSGAYFLIDRSLQQVYIPDDGSFEIAGPSRSHGFEAKTSLDLTRKVTLHGGITKVANAFFRGGETRIYVDSAPRFVANAALTLSNWRGWSGSLRMRAINHYRLDGEDPSILAAGHTVFDAGVSKQVRPGIAFQLTLDNLTSRSYYETQNYFESRITPSGPAISRIHATPGFPLTVAAGITIHFREK